MGDGYGFAIRIPGRRSRGHELLERGKKPPLQTFEEARSRARKKQVTPAYAFDLADEHVGYPDVTPSLYSSHNGRYYGNDFEEELDGWPRSPTKHADLRRANTWNGRREEHGMRVKVEDSEEVTPQSTGHRPRSERPMFEPSAPIPSYSHVSSPLANRKQR